MHTVGQGCARKEKLYARRRLEEKLWKPVDSGHLRMELRMGSVESVRCYICNAPGRLKAGDSLAVCDYCGLTGLRIRVTTSLAALIEAKRHFAAGRVQLARAAIVVTRNLRARGQ